MRFLKRLWQWPLDRITRHVYPPPGTPEQREALERVSGRQPEPTLQEWCAEQYPRA